MPSEKSSEEHNIQTQPKGKYQNSQHLKAEGVTHGTGHLTPDITLYINLHTAKRAGVL